MRPLISFICTFFAPYRQTILAATQPVKLALALPLSTSATSLLFDPFNNSMALLISVVFFHTPFISPVILANVLTPTLFTPTLQSILPATVFAKLALIFPFLTFGASLLFHPINNPMALLISIVFFQGLPGFLATLSVRFTVAVFAPVA